MARCSCERGGCCALYAVRAQVVPSAGAVSAGIQFSDGATAGNLQACLPSLSPPPLRATHVFCPLSRSSLCAPNLEMLMCVRTHTRVLLATHVRTQELSRCLLVAQVPVEINGDGPQFNLLTDVFQDANRSEYYAYSVRVCLCVCTCIGVCVRMRLCACACVCV